MFEAVRVLSTNSPERSRSAFAGNAQLLRSASTTALM